MNRTQFIKSLLRASSYMEEGKKKKRIGPSREKAKEIAKHGEVRGHPLTGNQEKFFRAIAHGWKPTGKKKKKAA